MTKSMKVDKVDPAIVLEDVDAGLLRRLTNIYESLEFDDAELDRLANRIKSDAAPGDPASLRAFACWVISSYSQRGPNYEALAGRLAVHFVHQRLGNTPLYVRFWACKEVREVDETVDKLLYKYRDEIALNIKYERDYKYGYFGYNVFRRQYITKKNGEELETPQDVMMRTAFAVHGDDVQSALRAYNCMSLWFYIHATPTMTNACFKANQMSSCFLLSINDDSIEGMYEQTTPDLAKISSKAGGMALYISKLRSFGSLIRGSGGRTGPICKYLQALEKQANHVDQGSTRKGALAIWYADWHADAPDLVDAGSLHSDPARTAPSLFYGCSGTELFFKRVVEDGMWSYFNPMDVPDLDDVYGDEFEDLYTTYEAEGRAVQQLKARDVYYKYIEALIDHSGPYMVNIDISNEKSNQNNMGKTRMSNLCTEIIEFSGIDRKGEKCTAVCNLASISLPAFVTRSVTHDGPRADYMEAFDFNLLGDIVREIVRNINKIIDKQYYPTDEARRTNMKTRPMGIGIQGLADVFQMLGLPHDCPEAMKLNVAIEETIYYHFLLESCELAKTDGPYEAYTWNGGSYVYKGKFHWELARNPENVHLSGMWDWERLRANIKIHGIRNSLGLANMPTASTSQCMNNNECFEPFTYNVYKRSVLGGEFTVINKHLVTYLSKHGRWTNEMATRLIAANGSVQSFDDFSDYEKLLFRTAFEIPVRNLVRMDGERQHFIDQSQSSNRYIANPTAKDIIDMHMACWEYELKTWNYYLHTKPIDRAAVVPMSVSAAASRIVSRAATPLRVSMDDPIPSALKKEEDFDGDVCLPGCTSCGS